MEVDRNEIAMLSSIFFFPCVNTHRSVKLVNFPLILINKPCKPDCLIGMTNPWKLLPKTLSSKTIEHTTIEREASNNGIIP